MFSRHLSVYSFYMHVVATVRFTELKISREEFTAPGEKGCNSSRDLHCSPACRLLRQTPEIFPFGGKL